MRGLQRTHETDRATNWHSLLKAHRLAPTCIVLRSICRSL
eukprot:CAMPEP_0170258458 /NCGR_PEP_ID=MMETSP0116_2-20130129/29096_1 /TAXON_ID=400756 /ORGANISM="Durinskia baltica, Strain CSIRO CS-38" /LENGTH=39 /DNA_ID= /DNA_START= /DNA_END= /DNA_ORIENTATION=